MPVFEVCREKDAAFQRRFFSRREADNYAAVMNLDDPARIYRVRELNEWEPCSKCGGSGGGPDPVLTCNQCHGSGVQP